MSKFKLSSDNKQTKKYSCICLNLLLFPTRIKFKISLSNFQQIWKLNCATGQYCKRQREAKMYLRLVFFGVVLILSLSRFLFHVRMNQTKRDYRPVKETISKFCLFTLSQKSQITLLSPSKAGVLRGQRHYWHDHVFSVKKCENE